MAPRHHVSGRFAARGPRQPRTEIRAKAPQRGATSDNKNAAYNSLIAQATKPAARATPGQLVSAEKLN